MSKAGIGLLCLRPRRGVDQIVCTLQLGDLDAEDCEYEALSYETSELLFSCLFGSFLFALSLLP
jgi:hypothetical protein